MRSRVMPGSSPTMARREPTRRLNSVDLPTLGRPTMVIRGAGVELEEDEVKIVRDHVGAGALTCPAARTAGFSVGVCYGVCVLSSFARLGGRGRPPLRESCLPELFIIETLCP